MAFRLLGGVIVPLVLLAGAATWRASHMRGEEVRARQLEERVHELLDLVELNAALFDEQMQTGQAEAASPDDPSVDDLEDVRQATDERIDAVPPSARPFEVADVVRIRQMHDARGAGGAVVAGRFDDLSRRLGERIRDEVGAVENLALALGDEPLANAITTLDRSVSASTSGFAVVVDLATYWAAEPFEQSLTRSQLARSSHDFERAGTWLSAEATGPVADAWLEQQRGVALINEEVTDALEGFRVAAGADGVDGEVPAELLAAAEQLLGLPSLAADEVELASHLVVDEAVESARGSAILGLIAIIGSTATAFLFARSILKPTYRITAHARAVGRGDLDVRPLPLAGPSEFVDASRAFNDLVANLQLMHEKATALARSNLEAPVLKEPLTGQLGETLSQSIQVLSDSLLQRRELQSRLTHEAMHDSLIGIANRASAITHLELATARAERRNRLLAVIFIDIDDFKRVNDTYGHAIGDEVLRRIGRRMSDVTRSSDLLARIGGDEFLLLAEDFEAVDEVVELARRMIDGLSRPIAVDDVTVTVSACAGVAIGPVDDEPLALLQHGDLAVNEAKSFGTGSIHMYDEALQEQLRMRTEIEDALSATLAEGGSQFELVYQPILHSGTERMVQLEALLRWDRPGVGLVPPDVFIPIAEASSLILDIDRWVLGAAFRQLEAWHDHPVLSTVSLAVNVSGRHILDRSFVADVRSAIETCRVEPCRLLLEVTETVLVDDLDVAAKQLQAVRDLGARVAVDDFGTGYTSLSHLRRLPIDEIKIDRSFVQGLPAASDDLSLIRMVTELAGHLGVATVAEGVETDEQHRVVNGIGCDLVQGYLFSRPLAPDALADWAEQRSASAVVQ